MNVFTEKALIYGFLFAGFFLLFWRMRWLALLVAFLKRTEETMEEASRLRLLENRKRLLAIEKKDSLWFWLERELCYSGIKKRLPFLTAERWILGNLLAAVSLLLVLSVLAGTQWALFGLAAAFGTEFLGIQVGKFYAMKSVNENLLKFLDFLGNYSITAGEVTGIFRQIARYLEEPLKGALEECFYEAQTTGDAGLALLSMAEKIEHPKFKEFARNLEINLRYCADFTKLVENGRRSIRDYLKQREERKSMIREAAINMSLLLGMSAFVLFMVDRLTEVSIWVVLVRTLPGQIALGVVGGIGCLFLGQVYRGRN